MARGRSNPKLELMSFTSPSASSPANTPATATPSTVEMLTGERRSTEPAVSGGSGRDDFVAAAARLAISIDELSAHWRVAFNSAEDSLAAVRAGGSSIRFAESELGELRARLTRERAAVSGLLERVAREEHVTLHRPLSAPRVTRPMLGLPSEVAACIFDLDGVLAGSAAMHAAAWAETFDEFLLRRSERTGERFAPFRPFDRRVGPVVMALD